MKNQAIRIFALLIFTFHGFCFSQPTDTLLSVPDSELLDLSFKYYRAKQYELGAQTTQKAINYSISQKDTSSLVKGYWVYGRILEINDNLESARDYYLKAHQLLAVTPHRSFNMFIKLSNSLGLINLKLEDYENAQKIFQECVDNEDFNPNNQFGLAVLINLSHSYSQSGDIEKGFEILKQCEITAIKLKASRFISAIWDEIGYEYYRKKKLYDLAIYYVKKAHAIDLESEDIGEIAYTADHLATLYEEALDFKSALEFHKLSDQLHDSLKDEEVSKKISELNLQFDTERKENELQLKTLFIEQQKAELDNEKLSRNLLFTVLIIILFFLSWLGVLFKKNRIKLSKIRSLNRDIQIMNSELERKVEERTKRLKSQNEKLKKYSFLNSHKVRAPLSKILGFADLMKQSSDTQLIDPLFSSTKELDSVVSEINNIFHDDKRNRLEIFKLIRANNVMLVDDDPMQNYLSTKIFNFYNPEIDIKEYTNAEFALSEIKKGSSLPDVIFLDINMPFMDGWGFLKQLEQHNLEFPVIMLTSSIDPKDRQKAKEFNIVEAFITKPLQLNDLVELFKNK